MSFARRHRVAILTIVPIMFAVFIVGNAVAAGMFAMSQAKPILAAVIATLAIVALVLTWRMAKDRNR